MMGDVVFMAKFHDMDFKVDCNYDMRENYQEALQDESFAKLVKKLNLSSCEAMKITTKLQDTVQELKNCKTCTSLYRCKNYFLGHVRVPDKKGNKIYFSYAPCKYQVQLEKNYKAKEMEANTNLNARMKDIDITGDKKRIEVIKWIDEYFQNYDFRVTSKGLYLHGNFGSGKTFLISALLNELMLVKHASMCMMHFPELLRDLKEDWESYESKMRRYQTIDLLFLDDIGAEKVTEWGRDEVLETILQYRMEHKLPTFFSSNMSIKEFEEHLSSNGKEKIKARRIIERVKQLAKEMELISENRRK